MQKLYGAPAFRQLPLIFVPEYSPEGIQEISPALAGQDAAARGNALLARTSTAGGRVAAPGKWSKITDAPWQGCGDIGE